MLGDGFTRVDGKHLVGAQQALDFLTPQFAHRLSFDCFCQLPLHGVVGANVFREIEQGGEGPENLQPIMMISCIELQEECVMEIGSFSALWYDRPATHRSSILEGAPENRRWFGRWVMTVMQGIVPAPRSVRVNTVGGEAVLAAGQWWRGQLSDGLPGVPVQLNHRERD